MQKLPIPFLLQQIPDAPKELYIRGIFPSEDDYKFLTIIGSRKFTHYGKQVIQKIIRELSQYPIVIVSGLALGIDSLAHTTALEHGMLTVAVPGSGLHSTVLYPASNRGLAEKIIQSGGALVSEYEPGYTATRWSFPKRNRIMAGMSHAVLVIEAENKSGTRITARLATDYNRDVCTVPGSIFSSTSEGCNELIREGATPVTSGKDVLDNLGITEKPLIQSQIIPLNTDEKSILDLLNKPQSHNALAEQLNISIIKLNILLSSMEIKGFIKEELGKIYKQ